MEEMALARKTFTSKSAVIRHVVAQIKPEEHLTGPEIVEKCNELVRKLPVDMQQTLLPISLNLFYDVRKADRKKDPNREPTRHEQMIRWTEWEEKRLAEAAVDLRLVHPSHTLIEIVRMAQQHVLAPERQRVLPQLKNIEPLMRVIEERTEEVRRLIEKGKTATEQPIQQQAIPVTPPAPPPPVVEPPTLEETLLELEDETLFSILRERNISSSVLFPQLVTHLLDRWSVTDELVKHMRAHEEKMDSILDYLTQPREIPAVISKQVILPTPPPIPTTPKPTVRKPKYLVGSLRKDQQKHVERACEHLVDLRFIDAGEQKPHVGTSIDVVVLVTKFVGHDVDGYIEAQLKREDRHAKLVRVRGGIVDIIETITRLAKGKQLPHYANHN